MFAIYERNEKYQQELLANEISRSDKRDSLSQSRLFQTNFLPVMTEAAKSMDMDKYQVTLGFLSSSANNQ